ncbi:PfkB family carbohydrate kinase [Actinacidiphila yeochonensis]|uniref:PfkB family carbohydrate kinase n=1 Tax=Actinacidiphila yeochonensis TaxID=89050 RepID=UPI00068A7D51|nr:PfkB family carbohydrate kinase [Actinacidiphila yeochonensis]
MTVGGSGASAAGAVVVGEALVDVLPGGPRGTRELPGGSPANVALGLARLGRPVRFATRLGADRLGALVAGHLRASGVELLPGSTDDGTTSTATAVLDASGAATYTFDLEWRLTERAARAVADSPPAHLHTGSIAAALPPGGDTVADLVRAARAAATVSYDPNLRPALLGPPGAERDRVERLVAAADVVKASDEDLAWLYPGRDPEQVAAGWATGAGPALVVLTRGARGAVAFGRRARAEVAAPRVRVADTVGAGDAFTAGLLAGLLAAGLAGPAGAARPALAAAAGGPRLAGAVAAALEQAARVAALTCAREGADPPTAAELAG